MTKPTTEPPRPRLSPPTPPPTPPPHHRGDLRRRRSDGPPTRTGMPPPAPVSDGRARAGQQSDYAQWYYAHYSGKPYDVTDPRWLEFFGSIADRLISALAPKTALDAGCAMGILVGSLRERGVDADGIDLSEYAINNGDPRAAGHLRVGGWRTRCRAGTTSSPALRCWSTSRPARSSG